MKTNDNELVVFSSFEVCTETIKSCISHQLKINRHCCAQTCFCTAESIWEPKYGAQIFQNKLCKKTLDQGRKCILDTLNSDIVSRYSKFWAMVGPFSFTQVHIRFMYRCAKKNFWCDTNTAHYTAILSES